MIIYDCIYDSSSGLKDLITPTKKLTSATQLNSVPRQEILNYARGLRCVVEPDLSQLISYITHFRLICLNDAEVVEGVLSGLKTDCISVRIERREKVTAQACYDWLAYSLTIEEQSREEEKLARRLSCSSTSSAASVRSGSVFTPPMDVLHRRPAHAAHAPIARPSPTPVASTTMATVVSQDHDDEPMLLSAVKRLTSEEPLRITEFERSALTPDSGHTSASDPNLAPPLSHGSPDLAPSMHEVVLEDDQNVYLIKNISN